MLTQRIIFAVLGVSSYLCAVSFGDDLIPYTRSNGEEIVHTGRSSLRFDVTEDEKLVSPVRRERVDLFPRRRVRIFPGNIIALRMLNHYENLTSCVAISPNVSEHLRNQGIVNSTINNAVSNSVDDVRFFGQCGVVIRANYNHTGTWRLEATVGDDSIEKTIYFGTVDVEVRNSMAIPTEPTVTYVQRGSPVSIKIGPNGAPSCQLRSPNGRNFPVRSGNCQTEIPIVTKIHEGVWTAAYSLQGRVNLVEEMIKLVTYDDSSLNASVTTTDNEEVNLLCSLRTYSFSFCQFVSPNGTVLNIFEGIGNDRYRYYGKGVQSTSMLTDRTHECGITILKPDSSDYGSWKCILGTGSGLSGSILRVSRPGDDTDTGAYALSSGESVYVVKGRSFTIKCSANAKLKYCWVGSPNGTAYSVSLNANSPTTLRYTGMGLSSGECEAVIPAAEATDEGFWHCGMGTYNGVEVESTVSVVVTDTLLMPNDRSVTVSRNEAHLSCSLIPGHEDTIDYCRWIQPSGVGIGRWTGPVYNQRRYTANRTQSSCVLDLENVRENWDTGKWTCVAGLVGSSLEVSATIQVFEEPTISASYSNLSSWCFGLGLGFISIIVACVIVLVVRGRLRSKQKQKLPPSYEKHHIGTPTVIIPQAYSQN